MKFKDYCRIVMYLPPEEPKKVPRKAKKSVEDEVEMRVSEDEGAVVEPEDVSLPAPHLRPPMFNPEDYTHALAKYARAAHLYMPEQPKEKKGRGRDKEKCVIREVPQEMSLKQFSSLPELLKRLREDLKLSYLSFVKELVRDPHDGVTLLLDVLKMVQLAQTDLNGTANSREQQLALRRALIDEHECLSCLRYCLRSTDAALKLAHYHHGLYTLAVATMSNLARSRTLALQLLTRACMTSSGGHRQVVEALAILRLRFAEPVKCKFLISMMLSHPHPSFQVWGMRFLNALVASSGSLRQRIYLQEELAEAGFDPSVLRKIIERSGSDHLQQLAMAELGRWNAAYVDVGGLENELFDLRTANAKLQEELRKLREANMKLLEENVLLKTVGGEVEERFSALQRRLEQNGIPVPPSPVPSVSDSDLSSLNTFRNSTMRRNSISPSRNGDSRSAITETDSVIFTQAGGRSITPVWNGSPKLQSESSSSKSSISSSETVAPMRPISSSNSGVLPPTRRSRHQSGSSTPEPRVTSPLRSSTASPIRNGEKKDDHRREDGTPTRTSPTQETEKKRTSGDRFNEHMPTTHIDMTYQSEKSPSPEAELQDRSRSPPGGKQTTQEPKKPSRSSSRQRQQISKELPQVNGSSSNGSEREMRKSVSLTQSDNRPSSKSSSASHTPSPRSGSPSNPKRKAPKPPSGTTSPLSSSTSSLSSSSSTSSGSGGERKDPEYMNVPRRESPQNKSRSESPASKTRSSSEEGDLDYERDVVVYEAITLGNDRIFIDKNNTQGSHDSDKSQSSMETKGSQESGDSQESYPDGPSVRQSVRHYENLVMMTDHFEMVPESWIDSERTDAPKREEKVYDRRERREDKEDRGDRKEENRSERQEDVSEKEVEAVMSGLENVLRSAESSLSLTSQETVKENPLLKEKFEDRASPENATNEELEIVPTRIPQLPARSRSQNSQVGNNQRDPVLFLEFESPAETSDTETLLRSSQPLPSPRTIETESTKSFGFIRPERAVRRHETFVDRSSNERESRDERRRGIKRSESFQTGNKNDYNSHRSYSPRRRGSMDLLVPLEEKEVHISGRMFTKYTPHEVERRNRVNELITAEMNRRKNRSMEDRLDQWFESQGGDGEWTLKWKYPEINPDKEEKLSRQKSNRRHESQSPTRYDDNRRSSRSKNVENRSPSKHQDNKTQSAKYPVDLPGPPPKPSRAGKQSKFSNSEISAFSGFKNPNSFRESDYGPNFMLNKPSTRLPDFADFADYGGRDYPPPRGRNSREKGVGGRRKAEIDPDIPTPDYSATPASTMSTVANGSPSKHILDMPSGLY
ncbi:uncharacterized protein LOC121863817 isoform X2 [Homarus americanus]|uniref:uncharacterized protein LOC121863817 isoform X2 n=1 Tax=Homarus americanus TaxID=6706 RepID=UPI001C439A32|nr:uncharacterized protein LOC121863817 isoform X2 [Homarus americanus]